MRVTILAIGRARSGPEKALTDDFLARFGAAGRGVALGPAELVEIDAKRIRTRADGDSALIERIPPGYACVALDERGKDMSSEAFSTFLAKRRDAGVPGIAFLLGGADGHGDVLRDRVDRLLAFGKATWPHMLARAMLAEQLYRAASIQSGHPYHRGG